MRLPIVKQDGSEFENAEELSKLIQDAGDDLYLLASQTWHGGIHISEDAAPWAKDTHPVRCIADGEVVAYRMMPDYLTSEFKGETLRYSNCFCLVRHQFEQEDEDGNKQGFKYFSLYMHLCPWEQWPSGERYRITRDRHVRNSVPENGEKLPTATLPKGETFERVEGEPIREGVINGNTYEFMRIRILSEGISTSEVLATQGTDTLWIAKDETAISEIETCLPAWIYDTVEAELDDEMKGRADPKPTRGDTGYRLAGDHSVLIDSGTRIRFDAHATQLQEINGKARKMARCELIDSGRSQWICVEDQYISVVSREATKLGELHELSTPVPIRAGDTIGYLGLYEAPASLEGGKTGNAMIHLEVFSPDDAVETVVNSEKWQEEGFRLVDGSDCDGVLDPSNVPEFFKLLCSSDLKDEESKLDSETVKRSLNSSSSAGKRHKTVAKHKSEWWTPVSSTTMSIFKSIYQSADSHELIDHETERALKLGWAKQTSNLGMEDPAVWHFYPVLPEFYEFGTMHPLQRINGKVVELDFLAISSEETISDTDYANAAQKLDCEVAAIKATAEAETKSSGSYLTSSEGYEIPAILFERHKFSQHTSGKYDASFPEISNPTAGGYGLLRHQYRKLSLAYSLDEVAALKSASWGKFQILGENHSLAGYADVRSFVRDISRSEKNHLAAFVNFIKSQPVLHNALKNKDWLGFATRYNGPGQDGYDKEMERNYAAIKSS